MCFEWSLINDAARNRSSLSDTGSTVFVPAFDGRPSLSQDTPTRESLIVAITERVAEWYAPFDLKVVSRRPASGPYTMVVIGGTASDAGYSSPSVWGTAETTACTSVADRDVAHVFSQTQQDNPFSGVGADSLARTAAHEAGHTFGLVHNLDPGSLMSSTVCLGLGLGSQSR